MAQEAVPGEYIVTFKSDFSPETIKSRMESERERFKLLKKDTESTYEQLQISKRALDDLRQKMKKLDEVKEKTKTIGVKSTLSVSIESDEKVSVLLIETDAGQNPEQVAGTYLSLSEVIGAMPNYVIRAALVPNDPKYSLQWNMKQINIEPVWSVNSGSSSVKIAVVDSGIDYTHEDIDVSRIVDDFDFVNGDDDAMDDHGHGTMVSGIIMAKSQNGVGVAGIDWQARILNYKVLDENGVGTLYGVMKAIERAINNNANVINMSLVADVRCSRYSMRTFEKMIENAYDRGVVVVAAAGNDKSRAKYYSPASCDGVVTVGATDESGALASYSNYGSEVEITAPGGDADPEKGIMTTDLNNKYTSRVGTSFAAPHVSAAAAILKGAKISLNPDQITEYLIDNADNVSSSKRVGPRLNVHRALNDVMNLTQPTPTNAPKLTPTPSYLPWWCKYFPHHNRCQI